uniref:Uncharacterized protein n=1 Tax=Panagrolaimus superbus TaxID=310955 RepID=A0A914YVZ5_9BILA
MPRNGTPNRNRDKSHQEIEPTKLDIDQLTAIVETQLKIGDTKSALFWAEKRMAVQSFKNSGKPTLYEIAQYLKILRSAGEWKTLCTYIINRDLHFRHLVFSYFYVSAMHVLTKFEEIVTLPLGHLRTWEGVPVIIPDTVAIVFAERNCKITEEDLTNLDKMLKDEQLEARMLYLLADTYLALQNRTAAAACIKYSIRMNPLSSEAVTFALKSQLLPIRKIRETLDLCKNFKAEDKSLMDVIYLLLDYHSKEVMFTMFFSKAMEPEVLLSKYQGENHSGIAVGFC